MTRTTESGCRTSCHANATCNWFSYDRNNFRCTHFLTCPKIVQKSNENIISEKGLCLSQSGVEPAASGWVIIDRFTGWEKQIYAEIDNDAEKCQLFCHDHEDCLYFVHQTKCYLGNLFQNHSLIEIHADPATIHFKATG